MNLENAVNMTDLMVNSSEPMNLSLSVCEQMDVDLEKVMNETRWINEFLINSFPEGSILFPICSFGVVGNLMSILVLTRPDIDLKPSFTNILISLAVYDFLFSGTSILMYCLPNMCTLYKSLIYPLICPYLYGTLMVAHTGSIFTTVAVTMERCITICSPFTIIKMWNGAAYIIPIVIISILYNVTKFMEIRTDPLYYEALRLNVTYDSDGFEKTELKDSTYIITNRILNIIVIGLIPFLVLVILNLVIYKAISKAHANHNQLTQSNSHRRDSTMAALLSGIVLVYFLCNSLKNGINLYEAKMLFDRRLCEQTLDEWPPILDLLSHISNILIALNSAINILIYVFKDFKFRKILWEQLTCQFNYTTRSSVKFVAASQRTEQRENIPMSHFSIIAETI